MINYEEFNDMINEEDLNDLENAFSNEAKSFVKVPTGVYEVSMTGLNLGTNKKGAATLFSKFKILNGDEEGKVIMANFMLEGNAMAFKLKKAITFINSLKPSKALSFSECVDPTTKKFDLKLLEQCVDQIREDITERGCEYRLRFLNGDQELAYEGRIVKYDEYVIEEIYEVN